MQLNLPIYIRIYVQVAHNFNTFYATELKFGMIFTQTKILDHGRVASGRPGFRMYNRSYWTHANWQ